MNARSYQLSVLVTIMFGRSCVFLLCSANYPILGSIPQFTKSILYCTAGIEQVTVNGKTIKAVQGQRLRDIVLASKAKIEYGCEKVKCAA